MKHIQEIFYEQESDIPQDAPVYGILSFEDLWTQRLREAAAEICERRFLDRRQEALDILARQSIPWLFNRLPDIATKSAKEISSN